MHVSINYLYVNIFKWTCQGGIINGAAAALKLAFHCRVPPKMAFVFFCFNACICLLWSMCILVFSSDTLGTMSGIACNKGAHLDFSWGCCGHSQLKLLCSMSSLFWVFRRWTGVTLIGRRKNCVKNQHFLSHLLLFDRQSMYELNTGFSTSLVNSWPQGELFDKIK